MNWCKIGTFLLLFLGAYLVCQAQTQTQPQEVPAPQSQPACDCEAEVQVLIACWKEIWERVPYDQIKSFEDALEMELYELEEQEKSKACFLNADPFKSRGCPNTWGDCFLACKDCTAGPFLEELLHLAESGETFNQRMGSIFFSASIFYADGLVGDVAKARHHQILDRILETEEDPLILTAALVAQDMSFIYNSQTLRRALELAGHNDELVSKIALEKFCVATDCPILNRLDEMPLLLTPEDFASLTAWFENWNLEGNRFRFFRWPKMAVTIDDLPVNTRLEKDQWAAITEDLLEALKKHKVPAIGFVNSGKCEEDGKVDPDCKNLLASWLEAGLELGNHTRSHPSLHKVEAEEWLKNAQAGETWLKPLVEKHGQSLTYFRHPYLHTGRSAEIRKATHEGLKAMGYTVAPVSIDNSEWIYAFAYDRALLAKDQELADRIGRDYLRYMEDVVAYYEDQSLALLGYELPQTLLLHANRLNGDYLDELLAMIRHRGYRFIPLSEALEDKAYTLEDEYYGPGGITWLHRWALTQGKKGSFFSGEPDAPAWVKKAAEVK